MPHLLSVPLTAIWPICSAKKRKRERKSKEKEGEGKRGMESREARAGGRGEGG